MNTPTQEPISTAQPELVDSHYYRMYQEQLEFFQLLNGRGFLFFRDATAMC